MALSDPSASIDARVVGRGPELRALRRFLDPAGATCLVLSGDQGIGKTVLWEAGVELAAGLDYGVLATRASRAESQLSYAALADLAEAIGDEALERLPSPQLRAIQVAVRRSEPTAEPPDPLAISSGLLSALRFRAEGGPVLVAIDDVQWLDAASAGPLVFAARRLAGGALRFLVTRQTGGRSALEKALPPANVERLAMGALSFGATARLLSERIRRGLPRRLVRRVYDASHGNPLFALEFGRLLAEEDPSEQGSDLPLPEIADDLFGARVRGLDGPVRTALLAVALDGNLESAELETIVDPAALQEAVSGELLVRDRHFVRASHPMLAATIRRESSPAERLALHAQLAVALHDPVMRAHHLALATETPDTGVADVVTEAVDIATLRGATPEAQDLAAQAFRLTPLDSQDRADRSLRLARSSARAGDWATLEEALRTAIDIAPAGRPHAFALLARAELLTDDVTRIAADVEQALAEAHDDPEVRARSLSVLSMLLSVGLLERLEEAEVRAHEAIATARNVGPAVLAGAQRALAWARVLRGESIDDLRTMEPTPSALTRLNDATGRPLALRLACRGEIHAAETAYHRLVGLAEQRGDLTLSLATQVQLCELELRAGRVSDAAERLDELDVYMEFLPRESQVLSIRLRCVLAATMGLPTNARQLATRVLSATDHPVLAWERFEAERVIGLVAVFEHDVAAAAESFGALWSHMRREGLDEVGAFPVAGELVEALVDAGELVAAADVTEQLERLATQQAHPWGLATARRGRAVIELASVGDDGEAAAAMAEVAATYGTLGLRFDEARTLLSLGRRQRKSNRRGDARKTLGAAAEQFASLGCTGWAAQAQTELSQVSGRRAAGDGQLTDGERGVVELAAEGLSNKEIASRLFLSIHTVETHLTHAYAKLGVRNRAQLAGRIGRPARTTEP